MIRISAAGFALATIALFVPCSSVLAADAPYKPSVTPSKSSAASQIVQKAYATPEEASAALYEAMKSNDWKQIYAVLGPGSGTLIYTGDKVADGETRNLFVAAYDKSMKLDRDGDARATLLIGEKDYPFPFPLVKTAQGWRFDATAGAEEIVNRRIGENELAAIQVCLAYVDAQREYVTKDRTNNGLLEYAQRFISTPGKQDGLYWETKEGDPPSPFGPLEAQAKSQGYSAAGASAATAYHGYRYKILTAQGPDAAGGAYNYMVKGKLIGGFAMVAYPARWGVSGVMSFICNHDGVVYEKSLGRDTRTTAQAMTLYNPDSTWAKVPQQ